MAFPYIDTTRPLGTQMVSTIDDAERETRSWLKLCMQTISGYPDSATVKVDVWSTAERPTNANGYLLGYNTTDKCLELVGQDAQGNPQIRSTLDSTVKKEIALLAHPVGEYYWTSDSTFDPNTAWGGTWGKIGDRHTVAPNNTAVLWHRVA